MVSTIHICLFGKLEELPKKQWCIFETEIVALYIYNGCYTASQHKQEKRQQFTQTEPKCLHRRHTIWLWLVRHPLQSRGQTPATQGLRPLSQIHFEPQLARVKSTTYRIKMQFPLSNTESTRPHCSTWATSKGRHLHPSWSCPSFEESWSFQHLSKDNSQKNGFWMFLVSTATFDDNIGEKLSKTTVFQLKKPKKKPTEIDV